MGTSRAKTSGKGDFKDEMEVDSAYFEKASEKYPKATNREGMPKEHDGEMQSSKWKSGANLGTN